MNIQTGEPNYVTDQVAFSQAAMDGTHSVTWLECFNSINITVAEMRRLWAQAMCSKRAHRADVLVSDPIRATVAAGRMAALGQLIEDHPELPWAALMRGVASDGGVPSDAELEAAASCPLRYLGDTRGFDLEDFNALWLGSR